MTRNGEEKQVSPKASLVMAAVLGLIVGYLGVALVLLAIELFGSGDTLVGLFALLFGLVLVAGVLAVVVSQLRAVIGRRG